MTLQQALKDKYNKDIPLSDLDGQLIELDTTTCGIVKGNYQYIGLFLDEKNKNLL